MSEYILFSCVGGHDPIASCADGAILHICRVYKPEKVVLYLSKEMIDRQNLDDRYRKCLKLLQEKENFKIKEIKCIERPDLVKVQLFDSFYNEFENIIENIQKENSDKKILLNVSSGTPAMKSALEIIAALGKHNLCAVQVSTPNKRENPKEDKMNLLYDVDTYWQTNGDNEEGYENRCIITQSQNLEAKIKKEILLKMIDSYDYKAAKDIAQDIAEYIDADALKLINAAYCRSQIDLNGFDKELKNTEYDFMPVKTSGDREIFEYVLSLQIKLNQGNFADFIRGITPVVMDLFERCLKNSVGIDLKKYCNKVKQKNGDYVYKLTIANLNKTEGGMEIRRILDEEYMGMKDNSPYTSDTVLKLMKRKSADNELFEKMDKIHYVEQSVRNFAAHEVVSVTDEWIYKRVGFHSNDIMKMLKELVIGAKIKAKNEYWNSYNNMNEVIKSKIK